MTILKEQKGIIGIEFALPDYYVSHDDLASELGIDPNKYKIGLGLEQFGVTSDCEDVISLAMTATLNLLKKYNINPKDVGRLEVGTESNFDTSKSIKSYLMDLFPNKNISGVDNVNACYGETNALLNAIYWLESRFWDGRYAIVVATDISEYNDINIIPTSGAGAVAILLGHNPSFIFEKEVSHYFANEHTFKRPVDCYPYPILDGKGSLTVYQEAFKDCFNQLTKYNIDYMYLVMHSPNPKLMLKTIDAVGINKEKLVDSLYISKRNGNSYTASLYHALISLLYFKNCQMQINDTISLFSFGSGCASSMFYLRKVSHGCDIDLLKERLDARIKMPASVYLKRINAKKSIDNYVPEDEGICEGKVFLRKILDYRRFYY